MSTEYNSKLIASLYEETDEDRAIEIADEMVEIGDPIFIQPIYSAYKKFKQTHSSFYFVSDIGRFKTPEMTEVLKEIAMSDDVGEVDFSYCLDHFSEIEFIEPQLASKAYLFALEEINSKNGNQYSLRDYLNYLSKVKPPIPLKDTLKAAFEDDTKMNELRVVALQFLLKEDPKENLKYYFDNFDEIKGKKAEIIFTKEILGWKNGIIPALREKILKEGSSHAKELIESSTKKEKKEIVEREKKTEIKYNNAEIITEISKLRSKINTLTQGDTRFNFSIFLPSEIIYQQTEGAEDKQKLIGYCMELRSFIQELDIDNLSKHSISKEESQKIIPGIENMNGSINMLHLYLFSIKIEPDKDLFGIRKLNQITSKLAHPDETSELISLLQENGLYEIYKEGNFQGLHRKLLEKYRDFLNRMIEAIKKTSE